MSKISHVSEAEIQALCDQIEDDFYDHKSIDIDGRGLEKIVVAFANADGGTVFIGIDDGKGKQPNKFRGKSSPEDFNSLLQVVFSLDPSVEFRHEFIHNKSKND